MYVGEARGTPERYPRGVKLGATLPQGDVGNGTKAFNYNSCNIAKAMARMGQLVGYSNAWVDNWPTY